MPFRPFIILAVVALPLALGAACDAKTKCEPTCAEAGRGAAGGAGAGGAVSFDGAAGGSAGGAGGALAACPPPASPVCTQPAPSFAAAITPILDRSCNTCHSDDNPDGIWPLHAWADVAAWQQLIITDLVNCTMPPADSNTPFPESDRQLFFAWLACNSPNN